MQKARVQALKEVANEIARIFGDEKREKNYGKMPYSVEEIKPLSESTAAIILKRPDGVKSLIFAYWINYNKNPRWHYFFPTESHIDGMKKLPPILEEINNNNFAIKMEMQ